MRGPTNWPKDGASPLDGVIETDWLPYTVTMNWQLTRPNHTVRFGSNEPICMISPCSLDPLEAIQSALAEPGVRSEQKDASELLTRPARTSTRVTEQRP